MYSGVIRVLSIRSAMFVVVVVVVVVVVRSEVTGTCKASNSSTLGQGFHTPLIIVLVEL